MFEQLNKLRKLLMCAVSIAIALMCSSARADWIQTRAEAREDGGRIRVQIWVSANVGKMMIEDRYLGGYNVPVETELNATLNVGIGKADLIVKTREVTVEATVTLHVDGHVDQTEVISVPVLE